MSYSTPFTPNLQDCLSSFIYKHKRAVEMVFKFNFSYGNVSIRIHLVNEQIVGVGCENPIINKDPHFFLIFCNCNLQ